MSATYLTKEGFKKLQEEFKHLQKQRLELTEEVNKAAALGDLRENGEYHAARERLQHVSTRLAELDGKLSDVQFIDDLHTTAGEARVGMRVTLKDIQLKEEMVYTLVGPDEADPHKGKLSIASPLGKLLLGKKTGEQFTRVLPKASVPYQILKIDRPTN